MRTTAKPSLLLCLSLYCCTVTASFAAVIVPFETSYFPTNYPASADPGSTADMSSGLWLGNLRGNDSWRDLIVANKGSNTVSIRYCNDNGAFGSLTNYAVGDGPTVVRAADMNADGFEDVIVANSGTNTVSVLINQNGAGFLDATNFVVGTTGNPQPGGLAVQDVTEDGLSDIVVANGSENSISILINDGTGAFNLWTNQSVGNNPSSVAVADFNGDGRKDILTANKTDSTLTILFKAIDGTFGSPQTITLFSGGDPQPVQALAVDLDGDGNVDIATANLNSNSVSVLRGPAFTQITNYSVGSAPVGLLVRDLNKDSHVDIAVANSGDNSISTLLNIGDGTFQAGVTKSVGANPASIAGSNFDNGGFTDLAVANNGDNTVSILLYDMPLADSQSFTAAEDQPKSITLHGAVFAGRTRSFTITASPTNGTLSGIAPDVIYTPDTNFFGWDSFKYTFNDGFNTSEEATITLQVQAVNDAPSFQVATNRIEVTRFGIVVSVPEFVTALNAGPTNESFQKLSFAVTVTNASFFSLRPNVGTNLTLNFKPSLTAQGTNVIFIRAVDDGGTAGGGVNTSPSIPVEIVVPANPFRSYGGRYNGLFYETNGVRHESSGFVNLTVTSAGLASGRVLLGKPYGFKTHFQADGSAQFIVSRSTNGPPLSFNLQLDTDNEQISGTVSDGDWTANLLTDRATFNIYTNQAPQAGIYTMLIEGNTNGAVSPGGQGYAVVKVNMAGKVSLTGRLADGTAIGQSAVLSKDGVWPFYVAPYRGRGSVMSWITFTNSATSDFEGTLSWIKKDTAGGTRYLSGFTNETTLTGSTYTVPDSTTRVLPLNNATATLERGGLVSPLVNSVILEANNTFTIQPGAAMQLHLYVKVSNGFITGSFTHPVSRLTTPIRGVAFQRGTKAGGYFIGPVEGGNFTLQAP